MAEILNVACKPLKLRNSSSVLEYDGEPTTLQLDIESETGVGDFHFQVRPITGSGSLNPSVVSPVFVSDADESYYVGSTVFTFINKGKVSISVYQEGHFDTQIIDDTPQNVYVIQSKLLTFELELTEKTIIISVVSRENDQSTLEYNVGSSYSTNDFKYTKNVDESDSDLFSVNPQIYFPNNSYDFYKFNVFNKANSYSGYDNGVRYTKNADGSWTIEGSSTNESKYLLLSTDTSNSSLIVPGHNYVLRVSRSYNLSENVHLRFVYYLSDGSINIQNFQVQIMEITVEVPETMVSTSIYVVVSENAENINQICYFELYDPTERSIDNMKEGSYPVSARGAVVSSESDYYDKSSIKYKSATIIFKNVSEYIFTIEPRNVSQDNTSFQYKPYTDVMFTVKVNPGYYYNDTWDWGTYDPSTATSSGSSNYSPWNSWWTNEMGSPVVCLGGPEGSTQFGIYAQYQGVTYQVPYVRKTGERKDSSGNLLEATYWIKMPISDTVAIVPWIKYGIGTSQYGSWTYQDLFCNTISGTSISDPVVITGQYQQYQDALLFCEYARSLYVDDPYSTVLMGGPSQFIIPNNRNYFYSVDGSYIIHELSRSDMIQVIREISHRVPFSSSSENYWTYRRVVQNPDDYLDAYSSETNSPRGPQFTYAGYPTGIDFETPLGDDVTQFNFNLNYPYDKYTKQITTTLTDDTDGLVFSTQGNTLLQGFSETDTGYERNATFQIDMLWTPSDPDVETVKGSLDDFFYNHKRISDLDWASWTNVITTEDDLSSNAAKFVTYKEAAYTLCKYARFRQFDIHCKDEFDYSGYYSSIVDDAVMRWALSNGLITGVKVRYTQGGSQYGGYYYTADDYIDRVEFAYMVYKFCQIYAW